MSANTAHAPTQHGHATAACGDDRPMSSTSHYQLQYKAQSQLSYLDQLALKTLRNASYDSTPRDTPTIPQSTVAERKDEVQEETPLADEEDAYEQLRQIFARILPHKDSYVPRTEVEERVSTPIATKVSTVVEVIPSTVAGEGGTPDRPSLVQEPLSVE